MKKSAAIALFTIAFAAALTPAVAYAQPVCAYPAHWVWRGYWNCEYPAQAYYAPPYYYPYYGYPYAYFGGFVSRPFFHGNGHVGGGFRGGGNISGGFRGGAHVGGGFRSGGGGHSGGGHGGRR